VVVSDKKVVGGGPSRNNQGPNGGWRLCLLTMSYLTRYLCYLLIPGPVFAKSRFKTLDVLRVMTIPAGPVINGQSIDDDRKDLKALQLCLSTIRDRGDSSHGESERCQMSNVGLPSTLLFAWELSALALKAQPVICRAMSQVSSRCTLAS
jgi:hypothetical protein